jgi:peptidyl-prolyl cis-trans isomerase C
MKFIALLGSLPLIAALALGQAKPAAPAPAGAVDDPVVITVGTEKITKSQFELLVAALPEQQKAAVQTPDGKRKLAEQYAEMKALVQDARAKKLDQSPLIKTRLMMQEDQVLANADYSSLGDAKPDAAAIQAYYNSHKTEWDTVKGRHILIRFKGSQVPLKLNQKDLTEDEALAKAKDLRAKIMAGAKFADIAQKESDDTGSGANGGDLGEFSKGQMVPEFDKAAFAQSIGVVGEPVRTAFGYHIILVEARLTKSLDDARPEIESKMKPELANQGLEAIKKKTTITLSDTYFGK